LPIRQGFDQYVNLRPLRLLAGVESPLRGARVGDLDMVCMRENSEGEYSGIGGRVHKGKPEEVAIQSTVFTRSVTERLMHFAFQWAQKHGRKRVTNVTKSNSMQHNMVFWDEVFREISAQYPDVETDHQLIDSMTVRMVEKPDTLDVFVTSNLFGDILTDLGAALSGSMGLAPSANLNPERKYPSLFQAIHGSAFDIAGKNLANPIASIWSAQLMLDFIGERELSASLMQAIEDVLRRGEVRTCDLGGKNTTTEVTAALCQSLKAAH
jgi:tartrate dehydrogenase/decarboxylase / D-malate dehydrogenase